MKKLILLSLIFVGVVSCNKDDDPIEPIPLKAVAVYTGTAKPMQTITLDGSASTGPEGFSYRWTYTGDVSEEEINLQHIDSAIATFTPTSNSLYTFTLTVTSGGNYDADEVIISTSGAAEIGGTLTENIELKNIQPDAYMPDYIVTSDLIIGDNIEVKIADEDVRIEFRSETGIHIKSGGRFSNRTDEPGFGYDVELYGDEGWKGILVDNGWIYLNDAKIFDAGATAFGGMDEAGVIVLNGSEAHIERIQRNIFENSRSYDILSSGKISGNGVVTNNSFSFKHPMKVHVSFMGFFSYDFPNYYPDSQEYSILIPSGSGIIDEVPKGYILFESGADYYIDGDLYAGSLLYSEGNSTIYMKAGTGILAEHRILIAPYNTSPPVFEGLNGANWKGIAINTKGNTNPIEIYGITIKDAGYGIISMGDFTAEASAAFYSTTTSGEVRNMEIRNSGGYGYYNPLSERVNLSFKNSTFRNTTQAAIRVNAKSVGSTLPLFHDCNFVLADTVPAVLVQGDGAPDIAEPWNTLGSDNYYLIDANIGEGSGFAINADVTIKFKAGRSLLFSNANSYLSINGTVNHPVILEGETNEPGSWGGLFLANRFSITHAIIRNGGEFILPNATEKANVISSVSSGSTNPIQIIENTSISESDGYGIVVENNTLDFDFDNAENNNTFSNNASGDVLRK